MPGTPPTHGPEFAVRAPSAVNTLSSAQALVVVIEAVEDPPHCEFQLLQCPDLAARHRVFGRDRAGNVKRTVHPDESAIGERQNSDGWIAGEVRKFVGNCS